MTYLCFKSPITQLRHQYEIQNLSVFDQNIQCGFNSHLLWNPAPGGVTCAKRKNNSPVLPGEATSSSKYYMTNSVKSEYNTDVWTGSWLIRSGSN